MVNFGDESVQRTCDRLLITDLPEHYDLVSHMQDSRIPFSQKAFGPGRRTEGISRHIQQEIKEINSDPDDVEEWIDVISLGLDGAWRCLKDRVPDHLIGPLIAAVLEGKQKRNENRSWPDWRDCDPNDAINHTGEQH